MKRKLAPLSFAVLSVIFACANKISALDWPEWLGPNREGVWRETGIISKFPAEGPKVVWRSPLGPGYSGPAVADGRVFVMDRQLTPGVQPDRQPSGRVATVGTERVLCLDAKSGQQLWVREWDCAYSLSYPSGPRNTPLIRDGRVYVVGAMGHLKCLDATTGAIQWEKDLPTTYKCEPPVWGFAAHPLLDGDLLYCVVGGEGSAMVALHKDTGEEVWKALDSEEVGYSPPIIVEAGGRKQILAWLSESINGLDAKTGEKIWSHDYPEDGLPKRPAANIITARQFKDLLFVSTVYHGPIMLKFNGAKAEVLWRDESKNARPTKGLRCLMSTPIFRDDHVYGISSHGELRCCVAATGEQLWESLAPVGGKRTDCGTVFIVLCEDRYVMFNDSGELIIAQMSPKGYTELDRTKIIEPIEAARGRLVVWSHPAFANNCVFVRNDKEIVCVSLLAQ